MLGRRLIGHFFTLIVVLALISPSILHAAPSTAISGTSEISNIVELMKNMDTKSLILTILVVGIVLLALIRIIGKILSIILTLIALALILYLYFSAI